MRTSDTDPIFVSFVSVAGASGRLGLTIAPGKKDRERNWDRDLDMDVQRLRSEYGTALLVSLIEDHELEFLKIQALFDIAQKAGIRVRRLPIRDVDVPRSTEAAVELVRALLHEISAGETVVVHCRGGLGRAGTIASCCLVALGRDPAEAIKSVRAARPGAVETRSQERFVHEFAKAWTGTRR